MARDKWDQVEKEGWEVWGKVAKVECYQEEKEESVAVKAERIKAKAKVKKTKDRKKEKKENIKERINLMVKKLTMRRTPHTHQLFQVISKESM